MHKYAVSEKVCHFDQGEKSVYQTPLRQDFLLRPFQGGCFRSKRHYILNDKAQLYFVKQYTMLFNIIPNPGPVGLFALIAMLKYKMRPEIEEAP